MTNIDEITVKFCEALPDDQLPLTFFSYGAFNTFVTSIMPPTLGYYKTYVVITCQGKPVFQGRYDIDQQSRAKFHQLEAFVHGHLKRSLTTGKISDHEFNERIATLDLDSFRKLIERETIA